MGALTAGLDDRIEIWTSRAMGTDQYNQGYALGDINDAVTNLFRGGMNHRTSLRTCCLANTAQRPGRPGESRSMGQDR